VGLAGAGGIAGIRGGSGRHPAHRPAATAGDRPRPGPRARRGRIFPDLTVEENLRLGAYLEPTPAALRQGLERVFTLFPVLAERRRQRAGTLSGGERQMLAIGRAVMRLPRLLLVDEVSMGLAPLLVETVFDALRDLRAQGIALLLVEQNAHEALRVVDRGYVLENGHLVLEGPANALCRAPRVQAVYLGGSQFPGDGST